MIRATVLLSAFTAALSKRTQARYESGKEGKKGKSDTKHIRSASIGYEMKQLAYEDKIDLGVLTRLEKRGSAQGLESARESANANGGLGALM